MSDGRYAARVPCGRATGHGESCCEARLCDQCAEISDLRAEVERLKDIEQLYRELGEEVEAARPGVVITDEQIDKAIANAVLVLEDEGLIKERRVPYLSIEDLGIVECPECGGSGEVEVKHFGMFRCDDCNGHGWIREERGDE